MKQKNYVAYLRQSTVKQEVSGLGVEAQREIIQNYLKDKKTIAEYIETESGRKSDRPKLTEALELCRKTNSVLIVAKLDRLSRNVAFTSKLLESDVEIVFCDFPEANKLVLHIISSIAEYEAGLISQRTKQSLKAKKARGYKLGKSVYEAYALTANNRVELLIAQARKFQPEVVVIANEEKYSELKEALSDLPIKVYAGTDAICQIVEAGPIDMVLTAMVGYAGLKPTINAIRAKKAIALANKETLVVAGELINQLAQQYRTPILPVDSEHSAVFQCLAGEVGNPIEKVILTASGGPFRTCTLEQLKSVTKTQALKHPNWEMGAKITIDSASMMNKGFEVIEAKWLFGVQPSQIEVVVHPQSVIHSMVQFEDGAVKAQLGMPDMRLPIQYAFSYPDRISSSFDRLDFSQCTNLTFEQPDTKRFRNLALAYEAMYRGGNMPCIVNAANEVVVASFLKDDISFLGMSDVIEKTMERVAFIANPTYDDYVATDAEARKIAASLI